MSRVICDLDDFCEDNHRLELLDEIKAQVPEFRATLFTIPGRCSVDWLTEVNRLRPWLEFVPHGWMHPHPRECQHWNESECADYLHLVGQTFGLANFHMAPSAGRLLTMGFKAPGWQISNGMLKQLYMRGWWVADQPYNQGRRPKGMWYYELPFSAGDFTFGGNGHDQIHGHIGHLGGHNANELELILPEILARKDRYFYFVRTQLQRVDQFRNA